MERFLFIGLTLALTVYGQLALKSRALSISSSGDKLRYLATMFTDVVVLSALAAAVVASICWILVLERTDIGFAYPFMALSFVFVPMAAALFFGEPVSMWQLVGLTMIVAGVGISSFLR